MRGFYDQLLAVALQPDAQCVIGIFAGVGEEQREVIGDGFIDPLVVIIGPAHHVAPPLMSSFMKRNNFGEMLLAAAGEAGAALGIGREKRKSGNIEEAGPPLAKRSGNLGDAKSAEGERAAEGFVEMDGGVDLFSKKFESGGGIGW